MNNFIKYLEDNIFGQYQPIYIIDQNTGNVLDSSIDWGYILGVILFIVVLYQVLRCIGGVIRAIINK